MNYWLDLFTGTTWDEFRKAGSNITGFSQRRHRVIDEINPGDIFLCYLTGVMRWVGALEVIGSTTDTSRTIWKEADFPVRFEVRPLILLEAEHGIPMDELEGRVDFFTGPQDRGKFKGFVRGSPTLFKCQDDGRLILDLLRQAQKEPVVRPVDPKKLVGTLPRMVSELPTQFNEATNRTIELIDVLWLKGNSIVAAFEVEYTTSVYSGLLRMSDLLSLQPNLDINLYLVAPDERRNKVQQEILRPTFELREKPL